MAYYCNSYRHDSDWVVSIQDACTRTTTPSSNVQQCTGGFTISANVWYNTTGCTGATRQAFGDVNATRLQLTTQANTAATTTTGMTITFQRSGGRIVDIWQIDDTSWESDEQTLRRSQPLPLLNHAVSGNITSLQEKRREIRSQMMLKECLTKVEHETFRREGYVVVRSKVDSDLMYIVRPYDRTKIIDTRENREVASVCRHLTGGYVGNDDLLAKVLELKTAEEEFLRGSNTDTDSNLPKTIEPLLVRAVGR